MAKTSEQVTLGGVKTLEVHKPCNAYEGCNHRKHSWRPVFGGAPGKRVSDGEALRWPIPWGATAHASKR